MVVEHHARESMSSASSFAIVRKIRAWWADGLVVAAGA
jgi:hypothetical protein